MGAPCAPPPGEGGRNHHNGEGRLTRIAQARSGLSPANRGDASGARVLFAIHTSTVFAEPFRLARLLGQQGIEPVFVFAYQHWSADAYARNCKGAGIDVLELPPASHLWRRMLAGVALRSAIVHRRRPSIVTSFLMEFFGLLNSVASARAAFEKVRPDLLVLSIDLAGYDTCAYVKIARNRGLRILLLSSIMSIGLDQAEAHYNDSTYHVRGMCRRAVARMFPKWITRHRSRDLFRVPPGRVLAMELLRLSPPKPWLFNSSHADVITMESDAMWDYYLAAGMPASQMVVTGSTADDVMASVQAQAEMRREALCGSLGLPADKPILLTALPPDFLDQPGGRPECDFKDYESLADFWLQACGSIEGCNVVVALHPSVALSEAAKFERYGARVSALGTAELVTLCDVFVASISSTIRWAIACAKPVVNYDVYRYRFTDFIGVEGVLTLEEREEFIATLRRLFTDPGFAADIRAKQQRIASHWGRLDGCSGQRMVDLAKRLLLGGKPRLADPAKDPRNVHRLL